MASESLNVTVYVKSLSGDLIELSVNPEKGLKGVEAALTIFDSDTYKPFQFRCFFIDEEVTGLTQDVVLGVVAVEEPMAKLEEIQDNVVLPDMDSIFKMFTFKLSSGMDFYVYTYTKWGEIRFIPRLNQLDNTEYVHWDHLTGFYHLLINIQGFSISDAYVIVEVLKKFYPKVRTPSCGVRKEDSVYCHCGSIVKKGGMPAHLKTKSKHTNGDARGKAFLQRIAAYVESL
jgi:hypothetical protein